jgi:hypothetical protein
MPLEKLTRERIVQALNGLGEYAEREQVELELCIYGGNAMILAYGSRETTKDVDAIVQPSEIGQRLAKEVAQDLGLDESWLNDDVRKFVSWEGTFAPLQIEELEAAAKRHLKITRASAIYLLAMKCLASRLPLPGYRADVDDIQFLFKKMEIRTMDQIEENMDRDLRCFPGGHHRLLIPC